MFDKDKDDDYEKDDDEGKGVGSFLTILFFPAVLFGLLVYALFRFGKLRFSVIASVVIPLQILTALMWWKMDFVGRIIDTVMDYKQISENWPTLILPVVTLAFFIGGFIGLVIIGWELREMRNNPHRLQLPGNWMYNFKFRRTPRELMKKKELVNKLKAGALQDKEKSPLGLNEEGEYHPVYRYQSEANKHTLIVGNSGSGKALHKDTLIPTLDGMKPVKEVKEGDILFDENGNRTTVLGKYQPMTEDHYEITFSDGTKVKACGDHRWRVSTALKTPLKGNKGVKEPFSTKTRRNIEKVLLNPVEKVSLADFVKENNLIVTPRLRNWVIGHEIEKTHHRGFVFDRHVLAQRLLQMDDDTLEKIASLKTRYETRVMTTKEMFVSGVHYKTQKKYFIPLVENSVQYSKKELLVDPYLLGAWLGDGDSRTAYICGVDLEVRDEIVKRTGAPLKNEKVVSREDRKNIYSWLVDGLYTNLNTLGLMQLANDPSSKKDIPEEYLYGSREDRIALISGLMDTDGHCKKNGNASIGLTNLAVIEKARQIIASLGWRVSKIDKRTPYAVLPNKERSYGKPVYTISFQPREQIFNVARKAERLERKLSLLNSQYDRHYITAIVPIEDNPEDYYCFEVDSPSHLFLCTESFIATHNTVTMQSLLLSDINNGIPLILIDMKRSPEFASKLATWTKNAGGDFYHFVNGDPEHYDVPNSPGQAFYDPLKAGTPTAKADMVLGMREYDTASAVYKANMQQLLQVLFPMLKYADKSKAKGINWKNGGIYELASAISGSNITDLAIACEGTPIEHEAEAIDMETRGKTGIAHAVKELQGQMRTIVASEYGRWLKTDPTGQGKSIDLFELTQKPGSVVLFSLNSDSEPDFARFIGSMIMADITNVSARRRNHQLGNQVNVYIDEFQAINPSSVAGLLEKSRESKIAMTLAQQSFEQIVASTAHNGEAYLLSIMDTCSNFIVHAGSTEDSAERLAKILGKEWVDTYRATNKNKSFFLSVNWANKRNQTVQTSREERWKFAPSRFMELSSPDKNNNFKATAVVVNKTCSDPLYKGRSGAVARTVWMIPPDEVLEKYYSPTFKDDAAPVKKPQLETVLANDDEDIVPNDFDLLASRRATQKDTRSDQQIILDKEDDDGGFGYEVVEEDDELLDLEALAEPTPPKQPAETITEAPIESKVSVRETSSFMKAQEVKKNLPSPPVAVEGKAVKKPGLPVSTTARTGSSANPAPSSSKPKQEQENFDEIELPDLNF